MTSKREYERRINRVVDYVERNPAAELSLEGLARIASFSPYHFHRVFRATTGETLFDFSQRLRIEKGARMLLRSKERGVLETAQSCGFASASTFARAFKAHFGMSATEWRTGGHRHWRERKNCNLGNELSKVSKATKSEGSDTVDVRRIDAVKIRIGNLPSYRVAYMRYVGPYESSGIPQLWCKLETWRAAQGLGKDTTTLGLAYDDPRITAAQTCRYDACVTVPGDFVPDRYVNVIDTASGRYAMCPFEGTAADMIRAWNRAFRDWLPDSGFEPDDKPLIELYDSACPDPTQAFSCELCLPVRPL